MDEHSAADSGVTLTTDIPGEVELLAFNARGSRLAVGTSDAASVVVFDAHTGRMVERLDKLRNLRSIGFLSPDILLVVQSGLCLRCDLRTRQQTTLWSEKGIWAYYILGGLSGRLVAIGMVGGGLVLYDAGRRRVRHRLRTPLAGVPRPCAFSPDERYLAVGLSSEALGNRFTMIYDVKAGTRWRTYEIAAGCVAFGGDHVAVAGGDSSVIHLYDLGGGEDPITDFRASCLDFRFAEGERAFDLLAQNGNVVRLQRGRKRMLRTSSPPPGWDDMNRVCASPDWSILAGAAAEKLIVWRANGPRD
jgi:WD40 repeat protein